MSSSENSQWSWHSPPGIIAWVGIFLDTFVYAPFVIYWTINVYKHRKTLIFSKRYPDVIVSMTVIASIFFLIQRNLGFLVSSQSLPPEDTELLRRINCYAFPIFVYGLYFLVVYRYWLLYYKTQFADAITNHLGWQSIINPAERQGNWWIVNKKKYGSRSYLIKYVVLLWLVVVCVEGTLWFARELDVITSDFIPFACDAVVVLGPCFLLVYIRRSLPTISDKLLLKVEIKRIFMITIVVFVVTAALASVVTAIQVLVNSKSMTRKAVLNATYIIGTLFTFLLSYMQTQWIFRKFLSHMRYYTSRQILKTTLEQQIMLSKSEKIKNKNKVSLYDVLTHEQAFVMFMNHLIEEHSSELLLSMVEMLQYKEALLNDMQLLQNVVIGSGGADVVANSEALMDAADADVLQLTLQDIDNEEALDEVIEVKTATQPDTETQSTIAKLQVAVKRVAVTNEPTAGATPSQRKSGGGGGGMSPFGGIGTFSTLRKRQRSVTTTTNGLLNFPESVPMSAIVTGTTLNFLAGIPGCERQPSRRRGTTVDEDVVQNSSLIEHVRSQSLGGVNAVWHQKVTSARSVEMKVPVPMTLSLGPIRSKQKKSIATRSESEMIEEWKLRAFMIYYKYIAVGAEYEINIDYQTRRVLSEKFDDINAWLRDTTMTLSALSTLFDNCIHQMYQLCNFSMTRFKQSDGFKALVRCFDIQHHPDTVSPISPRQPTQSF